MRISDIKFSRQKQKHSGKSENLKGTAILDDLKCTQERFFHMCLIIAGCLSKAETLQSIAT